MGHHHRDRTSNPAARSDPRELADPEPFIEPFTETSGIRSSSRGGGRPHRSHGLGKPASSNRGRAPASQRAHVGKSATQPPTINLIDPAHDQPARQAPRRRRSAYGRNGYGSDRPALGFALDVGRQFGRINTGGLAGYVDDPCDPLAVVASAGPDDAGGQRDGPDDTG